MTNADLDHLCAMKKKTFTTKRIQANAGAIVAIVSWLKTVKPKDRRFVYDEAKAFFDKQFRWPR